MGLFLVLMSPILLPMAIVLGPIELLAELIGVPLRALLGLAMNLNASDWLSALPFV